MIHPVYVRVLSWRMPPFHWQWLGWLFAVTTVAIATADMTASILSRRVLAGTGGTVIDKTASIYLRKQGVITSPHIAAIAASFATAGGRFPASC